MKIYRFLAAAFTTILFTSCMNASDEAIDLEKYTNVPETVSHQEYLSSIGSTWLTP